LGTAANVHFSFSSQTHLVTVSFGNSTVVLAGSFQSELGCPGDWQPDCPATRLTYDAIANLWTGIFAIPAGDYEYKVALNNSWDENYGQGGVPNGANLSLHVSGEKKILFRYNPDTHIVTTTEVDHTVILAGDFQSELGCPGDWQPDCPATGLSFDAITNRWTGQFLLPAGNWQFKVALNGSWTENYGEGGVLNGANISLNLPVTSKVTFIYNPETHVVTYTVAAITVVLPGNFQSELGCPGDWMPDCDATRLTYDATNRVWSGTFTIPAGNWEYKVALNNSWDENYGLGGLPNGPNISLYLATPSTITFVYDPVTHLVSLVYKTTGLCATAFYDANVNGYNDENIPLPGVTFTLSGSSAAVQPTGSDGKTCFTDLAPGLYTVQETVPSGYLLTTANPQTIDLQQPQNLSFGQVCLGGAGAKGLGFWTNKHGKEIFDNAWNKAYILEGLSSLFLRNADGSHFAPKTYEELKAWLQAANASNMTYMLSAQLAVLYLNVETGLVDGSRVVYAPGIGYWGFQQNFMYVYPLIYYTSYQLYLQPTATGGDSIRTALEKLKNILEQANSNLTFVQLQPCGSGAVTSTTRRQPEADMTTTLPSSKTAIWPNPSRTHFTLIPATDGSRQTVQIRVLDINGRPVFTATGNAQKAVRFGESLAPGVYVVETVQGSTRTSTKIVKQ
ncbi:MAG TPA: SpaA isopeptide-forming pilin-related protein, partial [Flavisolibacter sp.]|nr:SpaA isopeptide-forming pilin-related protein [Flavisolibacter sp.]